MSSKKIKKSNKVVEKQESKGTLMQQLSDYIMRMLVAFYVIAMLIIFPFYMEKKYLNMGDAKNNFFFWVSVIFFGGLIICLVFWIFSFRKEKQFQEKFGKISTTEMFAYVFLIVSFISYLCSADRERAFWGYNGWYMGLLAQTLFVLIFFFVSKFWGWSSVTISFMLAAGACVFGIAILQRFDMDIFRLYENIQDDGSYKMLSDVYIEKFISTLGQTSWYSAYEILVLPFGMFWYYYDTKKWSRVLSAIFIMLGAASVCTVNNDSAYIALGLVFMVLFWFAIEDNQKFARFLEIVILFLVSFRIVGIFQRLFPERRINLISGTEAITEFINHSVFMLVLTILVIGFYVFYRSLLNKNETIKDKTRQFDISKFVFLRKFMVYAAIFAVWLVVLFIILVTNKKLPASWDKINNIGFFNFDLYWGNHRGFNWRMAVKAMGKANFREWLVGVGPDCFSTAMDKYFYEEVRTFWHGKQLACAHNEWLNMLVNEGVLGLAAYLGIFISIIVRLGKISKDEPMAIPFMAAVIAYIGYNFFCYQQCICTPMIFIFMGMGEMIVTYTEREKLENNKS